MPGVRDVRYPDDSALVILGKLLGRTLSLSHAIFGVPPHFGLVRAIKQEAFHRRETDRIYIDANDPPTFLVHGKNDQLVPFGQSGLLAAQLDKVRVHHRFVKLPGTNHGFEFFWWGVGSSQVTRPILETFLDQNLASCGVSVSLDGNR